MVRRAFMGAVGSFADLPERSDAETHRKAHAAAENAALRGERAVDLSGPEDTSRALTVRSGGQVDEASAATPRSERRYGDAVFDRAGRSAIPRRQR